MRLRIVTPWKQDDLYREKETDYLTRLKRYASIQLDELKAEKGDSRKAVEKEGERILSLVKKGAFLVALTEQGKGFDSKQFSSWIEGMGLRGQSDITFIMGSSAGLSEQVIKEADMELSLSPMTFPHQLARVVLLEQIYRAFTIIKGEPYHK